MAPERVLWHPPGSFPKLELKFDPRTGRAKIDPDAFVLQAVGESRFHMAGTHRITQRGVYLDTPERPWRADWVSCGLYDDGWTAPDEPPGFACSRTPARTTRLSNGHLA